VTNSGKLPPIAEAAGLSTSQNNPMTLDGRRLSSDLTRPPLFPAIPLSRASQQQSMIDATTQQRLANIQIKINQHTLVIAQNKSAIEQLESEKAKILAALPKNSPEKQRQSYSPKKSTSPTKVPSLPPIGRRPSEQLVQADPEFQQKLADQRDQASLRDIASRQRMIQAGILPRPKRHSQIQIHTAKK
jgi:hypothetical protein